MNIGPYDIDIDQLISEIKKHEFSHILLHLPDGLKYYFQQFQQEITKQVSVDISFSGDSCYGACDLPCLEELSHLGIQAVFQLGHTPIPSIQIRKFSLPIFFIPALATYQINELLPTVKPLLIGKNIKIVTTAQHLHLLEEISSYLELEGFNPLISKGDQRIFAEGQILGCNYSSVHGENKSFDSILFLGSGLFHPIGLLLSTNNPVITIDPFSGEIKRDELIKEKEELLKKRYMTISTVKDCSSFGILISTKPGQQQKDKAVNAKEILTKHGKNSYVFILNEISPFALENFPQIDCFVSTACPRIAIDDMNQYKKPIITFTELQIAFDILSYDSYRFDEITD